MNTPKVGDIRYVMSVSENDEDRRAITELVVMRVGRKYFYLGLAESHEWYWKQYTIADGKQVEYSWFVAFETRQTALDETAKIADTLEVKKIHDYLHETFRFHGSKVIDLETLRKIRALIP